MQNQFDFEQLVKEHTQSELLDLHSEFSAYDNYSERIDFWDRHYLGLQLWYKIGIGEFLSILPVNESDIELFTEWALTFRMELRNYIEEYPSYKRPTLRVSNGCLFGDSFKVKEREFWQKFSSSPDRDSLLERTFNDLSNPKGSTLSLYGTFMTGDNNGEFYKSAERDLLKGESVKEILLYHFKSIPRAQLERYWNVWEVIDKVLDIESKLHFNGFLRDLKSRHNKKEQIIIPTESHVVETPKRNLSAAQFLLIEYFSTGNIFRKQHEDQTEVYERIIAKYVKTEDDYKKALKRVRTIIDNKITESQKYYLKIDLLAIIEYFDQQEQPATIKQIKDFAKERDIYFS